MRRQTDVAPSDERRTRQAGSPRSLSQPMESPADVTVTQVSSYILVAPMFKLFGKNRTESMLLIGSPRGWPVAMPWR